MSFYQDEPSYTHGTTPKVGIILANLGTPEAPTPKALKRYLGQFLMDRRIVEIPRFIWCWILHCIILVFRPKKSAEKYASIWTDEGSPLMVNALKQKQLFTQRLKEKVKSPFEVEIGMSYGNPSMKDAIHKLKSAHCTKLFVFPLFPQYASSSTGAALDAIWKVLLKTRNIPAIRTIRNYHDHPAYIHALAESVLAHWSIYGRPKKLIMSFHGVPKIHLLKGDPYHCECLKTGRLLAEKLGLSQDDFEVAFQSRFGRQEWLKPYLAERLESLGKAKLSRIDVICPGFSSDCLETLEEIAIEGKHIFQTNGGGEYHYIPCLNDRDDWINAMTTIALENLQGWTFEQWDEAEALRQSNLTLQRVQKHNENQTKLS
jgi:protoporphyrin/coproporphyrin ferrochelatase